MERKRISLKLFNTQVLKIYYRAIITDGVNKDQYSICNCLFLAYGSFQNVKLVLHANYSWFSQFLQDIGYKSKQ